ncbi:hypothetical protein, partial [Undibacterium sp. TS12]|uniref:hypothetical protein n=1 Tax=Undibacterium sp. TS12 TaxID=2908202 RepID=UPI001F4CBA67
GMPAKQTQAQSQQNTMAMKSVAANPYATMVSQPTPASTESSKTTTVAATPMQATSGSSAIVIPKGTVTTASSGASNASSTATAADSDLAMAALLDGLGSSLGSALQAQMDKSLQQQ